MSGSRSDSGSDDNTIHGHPYGYIPSKPAAFVFAGLLMVSTLLHTFQLIRTRTWFLVPFLIGASCEVAGYVARSIAAANDPVYTLLPLILSILLPLVAPTWIAASLYMELGRIIRMCGAEKLSIIRVSWLTKIFVLGDIVTLLAQFIGGALFANPKHTPQQLQNAQHILTFGFAAQIGFLGLYIMTAAIFQLRYQRQDAIATTGAHLPWKRHMFALYFAVTAILTRCIYHLITYLKPESTPSGEWPTYVLDVGPVFLLMFLLNYIHPSEINALRKHRGMIVKNFLQFSRPPAPAKFVEMYGQHHVQPHQPQPPAQYYTPAAQSFISATAPGRAGYQAYRPSQNQL